MQCKKTLLAKNSNEEFQSKKTTTTRNRTVTQRFHNQRQSPRKRAKTMERCESKWSLRGDRANRATAVGAAWHSAKQFPPQPPSSFDPLYLMSDHHVRMTHHSTPLLHSDFSLENISILLSTVLNEKKTYISELFQGRFELAL